MSQIHPTRSDLLNDDSVDYSPFSCCGDEDLVFLKCPSCDFIWVECFECSTWYVDLTDLDLRESSYVADDEHRMNCPRCETAFADLFYLSDDNCDRYLPTRQQVIDAGHGALLADKLKPTADELAATPGQIEKEPAINPTDKPTIAPSSQKATPRRVAIKVRTGGNRSTVIGAAIGAAGWIIGLAIATINKEHYFEAGATLLCAGAVLAVGFLIASRATRGQLISMLQAVLTLLAASAIFGLSALAILETQGVLEPVVDPDGEFPAILNFAAPAIILLMMAVAFVPPVKKFLSRNFV